LLETLDKKVFKVTKKTTEEGLSIFVKMSRQALELDTGLIKDSIKEFEFEILLTPKYPFVDPQVICHS